MYVVEDTLDDLMLKVFQKLLKSTSSVKASRGSNKEILGVLLELKNPRARLSRTEMKGTIFSCLGEFLWYLSKSDDLEFIEYYLSRYGENSDDGKTVHGAYGPRLFNMEGQINQIQNVIELLSKKQTTRRAVVQLFDHKDITKHYSDIPCTCTLQFFIRKNKLHMYVSMRSNDAYLGLPHDVFSFTMLQEIIARSLKVEIGRYKHSVGSLHLYSENVEQAQRFIDEGYQSTLSMPSMPAEDPWPSIAKLLEQESIIRKNLTDEIHDDSDYWTDLSLLLKIFHLSKSSNPANISKIEELKDQIKSGIYNIYIDKKQTTMKSKAAQQKLPFKEATPA